MGMDMAHGHGFHMEIAPFLRGALRWGQLQHYMYSNNWHVYAPPVTPFVPPEHELGPRDAATLSAGLSEGGCMTLYDV